MTSQKARIRLTSLNVPEIDSVCARIKAISEETGVKLAGPVPLPTKSLKINVRKSPCGNGTETYENYFMRIHKRLLDVYADEKTMRAIMRIKVPEAVQIEIELLK